MLNKSKKIEEVIEGLWRHKRIVQMQGTGLLSPYNAMPVVDASIRYLRSASDIKPEERSSFANIADVFWLMMRYKESEVSITVGWECLLRRFMDGS